MAVLAKEPRSKRTRLQFEATGIVNNNKLCQCVCLDGKEEKRIILSEKEFEELVQLGEDNIDNTYKFVRKIFSLKARK